MTGGATPGLPASRSIDIEGLTLAYVDVGDGPPVVCVHGNPSWSFYFRSLLAALPAAGLRAIAPDHIGMGRSDKPPAGPYPHTLARRITDFGQFLDAVVPDGPVSLVVHDWGGAIALGWAVEHPDRVDRLVLLNTAAFPLPPGKPLPVALRLARAPVVGTLAVRYGNAFARGATVFGTARRWLPREARRGLTAPYDSPSTRVAVHEFIRDIPTRPAHPAYAPLALIEQRLPLLSGRPTLICWGMRDFVLDERILARWQQLLPDARVQRYADAGHYVLEDEPGRIVASVVSFLTATSAS